MVRSIHGYVTFNTGLNGKMKGGIPAGNKRALVSFVEAHGRGV